MHDAATKATIGTLSLRLRGPLRRFFEKRLGPGNQEVEDLVQEVFVRLAARADLESIDRVESYLFQTAANLLRDRWRRLAARASKSHEPYDEALHGGVAGMLSPEREALGHEVIERLVAVLHALPERTRSVWALYNLENLTHVEIARSLGLSKSTIEKHMSRANARLLKTLDRCMNTRSEEHGS